MRTAWILAATATFCVGVLAAPDDRFKGGGIDGYDDKTLAQTSDDMSRVWARYKGNGYDGYGQCQLVQTSGDLTQVWARYGGGSYDGYDKFGLAGLSVPLSALGTLFLFR
jgi:hypothetical protein